MASKDKNTTAEFPHPYVTVDVLIFSVIEGQLHILLIRRSGEPFAGMFALPGAFVQVEETIDQAAERAIEQKCQLSGLYLEQLYTFGSVKRDPRGRVVSVSYFALVPQDKIKDVDDGKHVIKWFPVRSLPQLAFDHKEIIKTGVERLQGKITYTTIAVGFLPAKFRLTELQKVYETILERKIDKRNFRKRMASLDLLESVGEKVTSGSHRPAMLYRFKIKKPVAFN